MVTPAPIQAVEDALKVLHRIAYLTKEMNHAARNVFLSARQYKNYETSSKGDALLRRARAWTAFEYWEGKYNECQQELQKLQEPGE